MANVTMSISKLSEDKFLLVYGSNDTVTSNGQTKDFLVERTFTHRKSRNSPDCTPNGTIANIYGSNLYYSVAEKGLCKIGESIFTNFTNNKSHFGEIKSENTMVRACKENSPITQNLYIGSRILGLDSLFLEQNLYLVVISERSVNVWDTETLSQLAEYKARSAIVSFSVSVDRIAVATTNDRVYILRFRKTHDGHSLDCLKTFQLPKSKHAAVIALKGDYLVTATTTDDWTRTCLYDLTRNYGSDEPAQSAFKSTINAKIKFILLSTQYIIMTDKTQPKIYFISLTNNAKSNFEISIPVSNTSQQNTRISDIKLLSELCLLLVTTFGGVLHVYDFYGFERDGQTDKDRAVKDISANSSAEYLGAGIDFWKNSCLWDGDDGDEEEEVEYGNYGFGFVPRAQKRWRL
ncbi:hypothetical protein HK098_002440 [Nowakowskiella sp. JEL0407]|nr:hypothetical protein HK098_002440 [Nowakowskiella sp. JEL0407]